MAFSGPDSYRDVFKKFTKPDHESNLQVPARAARANNDALTAGKCHAGIVIKDKLLTSGKQSVIDRKSPLSRTALTGERCG